MKNRILKRIIPVTIATVMIFGLSTSMISSAAQKTAEEYKKEIEQYEARLTELKQQQNKEEEFQATLTNQITTLNQQLNAYQIEVDELSFQVKSKETSISSLNDQVLELEQDIELKNEEIDLKEAEKQDTIRKLKQRLRQDYMAGQISTLDLLLSSNDFGEFLSSIEYIRRIAIHDKELENLLLEQIGQIETAKAEVEKDIIELTIQKSEMESALAELQIQKDKLITVQNGLKDTATSIQIKIKESEQKSSKIDTAAENAANSLQEAKEGYEDATAAIKRALAEAAAKAAASAAASNSSNNGGSSSNNGSSNGSSNNSSGWGWPISTSYKITSGYGPRNYGSGYHYGVDFAAPSGTSIYSSMEGTVIVSTYGEYGSGYGGYGYVVVVSHPNGYLTLYAHMSSRAVSVGQSVSKGQTLGYVGTTGDSTGNHLHFEVRDSSANRLNPTNFIGPSPQF